MNGSDQIILIKLDIRISAGQQMFDDAACVCYYDVIIRRRVMANGSIKPQSRSAYIESRGKRDEKQHFRMLLGLVSPVIMEHQVEN